MSPDGLAALERVAREVHSEALTDEIATHAKWVAFHAESACRGIFNGSGGGDDLLTAARLARRLDLALVELAPVDDPHHPAWDVLFRWRDVVAKAGLS